MQTIVTLNLSVFFPVSLARMGGSKSSDSVSKDNCEEEMDRLKLEIQQCKDFIQTQQHLLQVSYL